MSRYFQDLATGENKKIRTRGLLFDSALVMCCQGGISNTRIEDITHYAGMANATFYNHFKNKDELLHALALSIVLEILKPLKGALSEIKDSGTRIVVLTDVIMNAALKQELWGTFLAQSYYIVPLTMLVPVGLSRHLDASTRLKAVIDSGVKQGSFSTISDRFQMEQVSSLLLSGLSRLGKGDVNIIGRTSENILSLLGVSSGNARLAVVNAQAFL
ncbi:MAG: AcrR family transcriptional regulator [Flavobacteriaceae bacterium]